MDLPKKQKTKKGSQEVDSKAVTMQSQKGFSTLSDVLGKFEKKDDKDKYVSREFQKYGYDLAQELGDPKNVSLYIKLAKDTPRGVLESARSFVRDATNARSKPALFLWKMKELKEKGKKTVNV